MRLRVAARRQLPLERGDATTRRRDVLVCVPKPRAAAAPTRPSSAPRRSICIRCSFSWFFVSSDATFDAYSRALRSSNERAASYQAR